MPGRTPDHAPFLACVTQNGQNKVFAPVKKDPVMTTERTRYCLLDTPLGRAVASAEAEAVTGFWFAGQKYFPRTVERWEEDAVYPVFPALRTWLARYFAGANPVRDFPLAPHGTPFQKTVWNILLAIPYGTLTSYGAMARQVSEGGVLTGSARTVGGAVGHNPISVLIPCHRVVGSTGKLTGYAGGLDRKQALLCLEKAML